LVKVEGALYSVPSAWKGLDAMSYIGPEDVRIVCRGEVEMHERQRFGGKSIRYRHYLPELARKPQALRQVMAELLEELAEPYAEFWRLLVDQHGPRDGARVFARVIEAVCDHGEEAVAIAVRRLLDAGSTGVLPLPRAETGQLSTEVPQQLRSYKVESASAASYDALLAEVDHE
jgi:hypothetical protein